MECKWYLNGTFKFLQLHKLHTFCEKNYPFRFNSGHIYTYIGPILVAVNPFKFFPIYNPKYAKLYQNRRLGSIPPHIFAIADVTYHNMLRTKQNQCVVISGESGSGKTESTNFLLHHLTSLSQKGSAASGLEQILLCAGPVLEVCDYPHHIFSQHVVMELFQAKGKSLCMNTGKSVHHVG